MKKDVTMRKNSFVNGALITTLGIIITKILGIIYVIPFHSIIGEKGGALYGYAYTIYMFFISLSSAGLPLAISKIVSEYQALGYYNTKKRAFILAKRISLLFGFLCFLFLIIFAPLLAKSIFGDISGGNTISDVVLSIRIISISILIVPILSIYRGYFEGHRFMSPPSISQVIEQFFRILVIIIGTYFVVKVLKLDITSAVGVALFGATVGAISSYLYLVDKLVKNKTKFNTKIRNVNEPIVSNKVIIKKIFYYSLPFIMIDVFKSMYNYIDMFTVVKGLVNHAKYSIEDSETIYSMLSTWATKFNMIISSISTGVVVSLIPSLTESIVKKNDNDINKKITQSLNIILFLTIPITLGISFLSKPIWTLFYGDSIYGSSLLSYFIFVGLFMSIYTALLTTLISFKDYKSVFISLVVGVLIKLFFNTNLLISFYKMSLPAYYGIITSSIMAYFVSFIICLIILCTKYNIKFEGTTKNFVDILCASLLMFIVLFLLKLFIPIYSANRLMNLIIILFYTVVGMVMYFGYSHYSKLMNNIFGKSFIKYLYDMIIKK